MKCTSCAASVRERDNFCWNCGSRVGAGATAHAGSCRACGFKLPVGSKFCGNCGVLQSSASTTSTAITESDDMITPKPATVPIPGLAIRVVEGGSGRIDRVSDLVDDDEDDVHAAPDTNSKPELERTSPTFGPKRPIGLARAPAKTEPQARGELPPPPSSLALERQARSGKAETGRRTPATWPDLRGELSELAFLRQQGLEKEARAALAQLRARYPGHPELADGDAEPPAEGAQARPAPSERARTLRGPSTYAKTESVPVLPTSKAVTIETAAIPLFEPPTSDTRSTFGRAKEAGGAFPKAFARSTRTEPPLEPPSTQATKPPLDESSSKRIELTLEDLEDNEIDAALEDFAPQDTQRSPTLEVSPTPSSSSSSDALELDPEELIDDPSDESMTAITAIDADVHGDDDLDTSGGEQVEGTVVAPLPKPPTLQTFQTLPDLVRMDASDRTVIAAGPQPPRPYAGRGAEPGEPPRRITVIPDDPSRPPPPRPFGAKATNDESEPRKRPARITQPATQIAGQISSDATLEPASEPLHAGLPAEFEVELEDPASLITTEGTVIARNPFPPAPFGGAPPPQPILPVRLAMVGSRGQTIAEHIIEPGEVFEIGRHSDEPWREDEHMLPVHARVTSAAGGGVQVQEVEPTGAVFRKLMRKEPLLDGDQLRVGQSLVSFSASAPAPGTLGRLRVQSNGNGPIDTLEVTSGDVLIGREVGEVAFPEDTYVSGEHCRIRYENGGLAIEDLGSSNGTYLRVRPGEVIPFEALLLIGQTQFCVLEI